MHTVNEKKSIRLCLVAFPTNYGSVSLHISNILSKFLLISTSFYFISSKSVIDIPDGIHFLDLNMKLNRDKSQNSGSFFKLILIAKILLIQLKISRYILKIQKNVDIVYFTGAQSYLIPIFISKLLGKKTVMSKGGSTSKTFRSLHPHSKIGYNAIRLLEEFHHMLLDQIAVQSESSIDFLDLNKFKHKISIHDALFIDTSLFNIQMEIDNRQNIVGYIGSFSNVKGTLNFVECIPLILDSREDVQFILCGEGPQYKEIISRLKQLKVDHKVQVVGWLEHAQVPKILNEMKIFVLPSYSEGVPVIIQEAMACGTIVLATPVGGIPDLVKNGVTGFIIEYNFPSQIAKNILSILDLSSVSDISLNSRLLIENNYSLDILSNKTRQELLYLVHGKE